MTTTDEVPWLSVIMPIHNGAHFLEATLASAAAEADAGMEFLCFDSGDDNGASREVAERFAGRMDIRWTATPDLKPWTSKTNLGVRQARAAHIVMLHQDDLWLPGHGRELAKTVRDMSEGNYPLSIGPSRLVGSKGQDAGSWNLPFRPGRIAGRELASTLLVQNTISVPSPVVDRAAFLSAGGMDDDLWYTADWDLYLKLALLGDVLVRPGATTAFRLHGGSLTMTGSGNIAEFRAQQEAVLERYLPQLMPLRSGVLARARASVAVNCALAAASRGQLGALAPAMMRVLLLGPWGWYRFLHDTRLVDRVGGRLLLKLARKL